MRGILKTKGKDIKEEKEIFEKYEERKIKEIWGKLCDENNVKKLMYNNKIIQVYGISY